MHERKALMADLTDGFVALFGGIGTLDEFCEMITWTQLGLHGTPGILNVLGYYSSLLAMFDLAMREQFLKPENRQLVLSRDSTAGLLEALEGWRPTPVAKWLDRKARSATSVKSLRR